MRTDTVIVAVEQELAHARQHIEAEYHTYLGKGIDFFFREHPNATGKAFARTIRELQDEFQTYPVRSNQAECLVRLLEKLRLRQHRLK